MMTVERGMYMTKADRMKQFRVLMERYRKSNPAEYESLELSLLTIGFFECPASTKFHGAYEGGLFDHSFTVAKCLRSLTDRLELKWRREESPEIIGVLHDICKTLKYKKTASGYEYIKGSPEGHGELSVEMLADKIILTIEEKESIYWHMGAFTDAKQWPEYTAAIQRFPNVLWTHTADMMAAYILNA